MLVKSLPPSNLNSNWFSEENQKATIYEFISLVFLLILNEIDAFIFESLDWMIPILRLIFFQVKMRLIKLNRAVCKLGPIWLDLTQPGLINIDTFK